MQYVNIILITLGGMIIMEQNIFEWSDDYSIGVKEIDDAHKQLFSIF